LIIEGALSKNEIIAVCDYESEENIRCFVGMALRRNPTVVYADKPILSKEDGKEDVPQFRLAYFTDGAYSVLYG
jgi:hypothetical protein